MRALFERILVDFMDAVDYFLESLLYVGDMIGGFVLSLISDKYRLTAILILVSLVISTLGF